MIRGVRPRLGRRHPGVHRRLRRGRVRTGDAGTDLAMAAGLGHQPRRRRVGHPSARRRRTPDAPPRSPGRCVMNRPAPPTDPAPTNCASTATSTRTGRPGSTVDPHPRRRRHHHPARPRGRPGGAHGLLTKVRDLGVTLLSVRSHRAPPHLPPGTQPMITVDSVTRTYGGFTAVDDVSFTAEPGRVTGFLGPNGAGKSTTMRILVGLTAARRARPPSPVEATSTCPTRGSRSAYFSMRPPSMPDAPVGRS